MAFKRRTVGGTETAAATTMTTTATTTTTAHDSPTRLKTDLKSSYPSSPSRLLISETVAGTRPRLNSRDIPRSYSGLYGQDDLLPLELARSQHTDWLEKGGWLLGLTYAGGVWMVQIVILLTLETLAWEFEYKDVVLTPVVMAWTLVHILHFVLSFWFLHWLKGSEFDLQGEMNALTLWEQLEGRDTTLPVKRVLYLVPTILCYAACHACSYHPNICLINIFFWCIAMLAKLPFMNGVRIFGINTTTGIDDETSATPSSNKTKDF